MEIRCKKLHPNATIPSYAHHNDAGVDLFCPEDVTIPAGQQVSIPIGIAQQLPDGYVALVWDKSGISAKRRLKVMGGVIDAGYRGELIVTLTNLGTEDQLFTQGEKIAQMLIQKVQQPDIIEVEQLDDSSRGSGKFGSTGS